MQLITQYRQALSNVMAATGQRAQTRAEELANSLGVGPGYVQHNEYVAEVWYGWQATGWMNLKFDAQYVILPGGYTTPTNRNAFVLGVRTSVDF